MLVCSSAQIFCHRLASSTQKLDFLFSNFGLGVLHSPVMFQCIECYLTKREPGIRFQQPPLIKSLNFLILTFYFSCLDQTWLPIAVVPFIYWNKAQKNVLKTLSANCMNNFHVEKACCSYKALGYAQNLSQSGGGSKVSKPICDPSQQEKGAQLKAFQGRLCLKCVETRLKLFETRFKQFQIVSVS